MDMTGRGAVTRSSHRVASDCRQTHARPQSRGLLGQKETRRCGEPPAESISRLVFRTTRQSWNDTPDSTGANIYCAHDPARSDCWFLRSRARKFYPSLRWESQLPPGSPRGITQARSPSRPSRIARRDASDVTTGAISWLSHLGRVRTPSFRTLKVGSRTEDPRRTQSSPHAAGNVPRRPTQRRSTRARTLPFLAVAAWGRLSLPPSQPSSPSES